MVSVRPLVSFCVAFWLAAMPAGMTISIAMEKASAMITISARIFRLERFLNALVVRLILFTFIFGYYHR